MFPPGVQWDRAKGLVLWPVFACESLSQFSRSADAPAGWWEQRSSGVNASRRPPPCKNQTNPFRDCLHRKSFTFVCLLRGHAHPAWDVSLPAPPPCPQLAAAAVCAWRCGAGGGMSAMHAWWDATTAPASGAEASILPAWLLSPQCCWPGGPHVPWGPSWDTAAMMEVLLPAQVMGWWGDVGGMCRSGHPTLPTQPGGSSSPRSLPHPSWRAAPSLLLEGASCLLQQSGRQTISQGRGQASCHGARCV